LPWRRVRRLSGVSALALGAAVVVAAAGLPGSAPRLGGSTARLGTTAQSGAGDCIAHHPNASAQYPVWYTAGCTGHDEPELDPVSSAPGSAQDLTWTAVLPADGSVPVSAVGPTFWWGGTVTDPNPHALFGQAFLEVQFYPDAIVNNCSAAGGFNVKYAPDKFTVCSPVWQVSTQNFAETSAFNAELYDGTSSQPLIMNAGDTIRIHFFMASASDGWHIQVTDVTTGHSGIIVLNSTYGPLQPAFGTQQIGNALGWGLVNDTPNSFVWEIGHTSPFTTPASRFCLPGQTFCDSYDTAHWLGFTPLKITSVTFADGSGPSQWAVVSDFGGTAEVNQYCSSYGGPYCTYPWFAFNSAASALTYGGNYPGTKPPYDYGQAGQFATTMTCGGPFGTDSTYCDTILTPNPQVG
jgi:hypothetical protein